MTIFVESKASEINLPSAVRVANLELLTGADMMISPLKMPASTRQLIVKHLDSGAILLQLKYAEDLAASVGDRLNDSIARMRDVTLRTAQHWLVFIGTLGKDHEGSALINGHRTHRNVSFKTIDGAVVGWLARGGVWYALPRESMLEEWAGDMERRLGEYAAQQYKYVYNVKDFPDALPSIQDDPLQLPIRVRDGRVTILSLPGVGVELAERIWAYCGSLKASLNLLTDESSAGKVEGVGKGKIEKIRAYFGLEAGESLWLRSEVDEISSKAIERLHKLSDVERKKVVARDTAELFGNGKRGK